MPIAPSINPTVNPTSVPTWIASVLQQIGAPLTTANVQALKLWAGSENTAAQYNPLATTLGSPASGVSIPGSSQFNSVGVQNYASESTGSAAMASTLNEPRYASIKNAFLNGNDLPGIIAAVNASPWGSHIGSGTQPLGTESTTAGATATLTSASGTAGCNASKGIGGLGITLLSGCQLKALKGGALALAGGLLLVTGTVLIIAKTGLGKKAVEATGAGYIAEKVMSRSPSKSTASPQPSAAEMSGDPNRRGSASSKLKMVNRPGARDAAPIERTVPAGPDGPAF
jgi:hypothetical protein